MRSRRGKESHASVSQASEEMKRSLAQFVGKSAMNESTAQSESNRNEAVLETASPLLDQRRTLSEGLPNVGDIRRVPQHGSTVGGHAFEAAQLLRDEVHLRNLVADQQQRLQEARVNELMQQHLLTQSHPYVGLSHAQEGLQLDHRLLSEASLSRAIYENSTHGMVADRFASRSDRLSQLMALSSGQHLPNIPARAPSLHASRLLQPSLTPETLNLLLALEERRKNEFERARRR